jgi:hypothetical protein
MSTMTVLAAHLAPMATMGSAFGVDTETGDEVTIGVDHRPLRNLIEEAEAEYEATGEPLVVEYEDWQVLRRTPAEEVV